MKALNDLRIFTETARQGSFSKAADSLGLTPAAVSAAIKRLEEQIGFPLFVRSTRSLRLTSEGELFLGKTEQALDTLQSGLDEISETRGELAGKIHISAPSDLGRNLVLDWISEFITLHPKVKIKLELSDQLADMYSQPIDLAIRYGEPADSGLVAIPLCNANEWVLCGSPEYLANHAPIEHPQDLLSHNCLCYMRSGNFENKWVMKHDDATETLLVSGNPGTNDGEVLRQLAVKGKGIAAKSMMDVSQDIIEGRLIRVLPHWHGGMAPLYSVCADRRVITPTIRKFQEFLREKCCQQRKAVLAAIEAKCSANKA